MCVCTVYCQIFEGPTFRGSAFYNFLAGINFTDQRIPLTMPSFVGHMHYLCSHLHLGNKDV